MDLSPLYKRIGKWIFAHPLQVLGAALLLAVLGGFLTTRISIRADLKDLLPADFESIRGLEELQEIYGGPGYLLLGLEVKRPEDARDFLSDLAPQLAIIPEVRFVSYRRPIDFFLNHLPLFLELEDLQEIKQRLEKKLAEMKQGANPLFDRFLNFYEEDEVDFDDIISKYEEMEILDFAEQEYYRNEAGTFFATLIKPSFSHKDLAASRKLVAEVERRVQELQPEKYGAGVRVSYAGEYRTNLDAERHLKAEIEAISSVVLILLMLVLSLYYRRLSALPLIGIPLLSGIAWTGGLVYLLLGHVNMVTGFSAMILAGLGSDYGIYLLTRFLQDREQGRSLKLSFQNCFALTSRATRISALTTLIAFAILSLSELTGIAELGIIGVIGILMNFVAMHTVLPALMVLSDRKGILDWEKRFFPWSPQLRLQVTWLRLSLPTVVVFVCFGLLALSQGARLWDIKYDRTELESAALSSEATDQKISALFKNSLRPAVIVVEGGEAKEREILQAIERQSEGEKSLRMIKGGLGLASFVPQNQPAKNEVIEQIQKDLRSMRLTLLGGTRRLVNYFLSYEPHGRMARQDLPEELVQLFRARNSSTSLVFVFPNQPRDTEVQLRAYVRQLQAIRMEEGRPVNIISDQFVPFDILNLIEREAPWAFLLMLLLSFTYLLVETRRVRSALLLSTVILFSFLLFLGSLSPLGLGLNFFNIAAVLIVLGTGFDSVIHLYQRYQENETRVMTAFNQMAPSIVTANLTTAIGFGGFIATDTLGLRSLGWLVIVGMTVITATTLLFLPAALTLHQRWR